MDISTLVLLFLAGGIAGFIDSIAGGGGIITVPALLAMGFPPHQALATNKLQSSFGGLTAAVNYSRKGLMNPRELLRGVLFSLLGGISGSIAVQFFSAGFLENLIIIMLIVLFLYTALSPKLGFEKKPHVMNPALFYTFFGLLIGAYDGFFGPGTGSFWTIALVLLLGCNLKQATAQTKLFNATSNIVALTVFIFSGLVLWIPGLTMGAGQIIGSYAGSTLVSKKEIHFIRIFFLIVVAATIVKLILNKLY